MILLLLGAQYKMWGLNSDEFVSIYWWEGENASSATGESDEAVMRRREEPTGSASIKRKLISSLEEFPSSRGRGETLKIRLSIWLQLCLSRKLQKCLVDSDTSPPPSAQRWVDADWTVFRQLVFILMLSCWAELNSLGLNLSPSTGGKEKRSRQPQVKVMKQWWGGGRSQQAACP